MDDHQRLGATEFPLIPLTKYWSWNVYKLFSIIVKYTNKYYTVRYKLWCLSLLTHCDPHNCMCCLTGLTRNLLKRKTDKGHNEEMSWEAAWYMVWILSEAMLPQELRCSEETVEWGTRANNFGFERDLIYSEIAQSFMVYSFFPFRFITSW